MFKITFIIKAGIITISDTHGLPFPARSILRIPKTTKNNAPGKRIWNKRILSKNSVPNKKITKFSDKKYNDNAHKHIIGNANLKSWAIFSENNLPFFEIELLAKIKV